MHPVGHLLSTKQWKDTDCALILPLGIENSQIAFKCNIIINFFFFFG